MDNSTDNFSSCLFWVSAVVLAYTFVGYPFLIFILSRLWPRPLRKTGTQAQAVSVVLAAHNEEQRIGQRLENLLASDFPKDKLEIIVVSDGSTDRTVEMIQSLNYPRVQLLIEPARSGKSHCLNRGVAAASGELIVFGDVRQRFSAQTVSQLASHFSDPSVGAVSGSLEIESSGSAIGSGVDAYWRLEKFLRHSESIFHSCIGCTGAVYAIRRSLFQKLPGDTLLDDVVIPMQIAAQGYRVLFEPSAVAYDPQTLEPEREHIRKQRTLAGNYQMLFRYPDWLLPWKNPLWWQLLSHKYLRLIAPFFMLLLFFSNVLLVKFLFYRLIFLAQCSFYLLAAFGALFKRVKIALFSIPAGFVFLNMMSLSGLRHYLRGSYRHGSWPATK